MWRRIVPLAFILSACDLPIDVTDQRTQQAGTAPNLAPNPSLETDANADQVPDCWQRGGYGTNSATYTLTSNAYDGSVAQRIDVTSLSSGARRIVTKQDTGACAPAAIAGHTYNVTAHYLSNTQPIFTVYYRNSSGSWVWFAQSSSLPTSSSYALASYTTPVLPSGATAISVGLSIVAVGSLTMDAFSLTDTADGGPDTTPPTVSIVTPSSGSTVSGTVEISALANDTVGVARVEFYVNGTLLGTDTTAPYNAEWNTPSYAGTNATLTARAFDTSGNAATSAPVTVTVGTTSDTTPPTVNFVTPADGATVGGDVQVRADVTDAGGVDRVELWLDDQFMGDVRQPPYIQTWNTQTFVGQTVKLFIRAYDKTQNLKQSETHTVTVVAKSDYTAPTVALTSPADGATVSGTITLSADASDDVSVARVDFFANGPQFTEGPQLIATELDPPYSASWDSSVYSGQTITVTARAVDTQGNETLSAAHTITVGAAVTNLLKNPSLEVDANGDQIPDCWKRDYYGTNTRTFTITNDAFDGSRAIRTDITSFTSGGARLASAQDTGACAPAVTPGRTYTMTAYYKSNVQPKFSVYYRNSSGSWVWLAESSSLPASSSYRQATYTSPPLPAGATNISIGLSIFSAGSITTDAYTLVGN